MNSFLLWIGGLLVAVLAALFAVPHLVDWNSWRGVFEEEASRVLAREVRLSGNVALRLLPSPYVRFEKLRIANADGKAGEPFFRAEALTIGLSVSPLLRGAIEANDVEIERPVLRLAADSNGTGNWANFELAPGALPFVPTNVVLSSVKIRDGSVVFDAAGAPATLTGINAEIEASALAGPYKIRADALWNGEARDIRLSTAAREANGAIRTKLTVRAPASGNTYGFDGTLSDIWGRTRYDGQATARLPISGTGPRDDAFDVRGVIAGDALAAALSDLVVSYDREGRPQSLTGIATARWNGPLEIETRWQSRWLDLDGLRRDTSVGPLALAKDLAERAVALVPASGTTRATLEVDQVNVGGDAITGVRVDAASSGGTLQISELKAGLPGGTRLDLKGTVAGTTAARAFEGEVILRGTSLQRFTSWASAQAAAVKSDGPFLLSSGLGLGSSSLSLKRAVVEFGGVQVSGALGYDWAKTPALDLAVDGSRIDLGPIAPGSLDLDVLAVLLAGSASAPTDGQPTGLLQLLGTARRDLKLAIRADTLTDGVRTLRDVDARLATAAGKLDISALSFRTANGLKVEAEGAVSAADGPLRGELRGVMVAPTVASLADVEMVLGGRFGSPRVARLPVPSARAAFSATFGGRVRDAVEVRVDGLLARSRIEGALQLAGGVANWRKAPIELALTVDGPDTHELLRVLRTSGLDPARSAAQSTVTTDTVLQGRLSIRAAGRDASALGLHAEIDTEPLSGSLNGVARIDGDNLTVEGDADIVVGDVGTLLEATGIRRRPNLDAVALDGVIGVKTAPGQIVLSPRGVKLAGATVSGSVALRPGDATGPIVIDARLRSDIATVSGLLRLVTSEPVSSAVEIDAPAHGPWPEEPFALGWTDDVTGRVALRVESLSVAPGMTLAQAGIEADLKPGRIDAKLDGAALAGRVAAVIGLERAQAGASAAVGVRLEKLDLAALQSGPADKAGPTGSVSLSLQVQGRALTPASLIASLTGQGELSLAQVRLPMLTPRLLAQAVSAVVVSADPPPANVLTQRMATARAPVDLGTRTLKVEIGDGALKIARFSIDVPDGRVSNGTTVELATLRADSDTRIEARVPELKSGSRNGTVGVAVVHVGPLAVLTDTMGRIESDAAEREVTVRRMERDVERLEQLRREDAERARQAAERALQSQQQQQQQAQPPQVPQPAQPGPPVAESEARSAVTAQQVQPESSGGGTAETTHDAVRPAAPVRPTPRPAPRNIDPFAQGDPIEALKKR